MVEAEIDCTGDIWRLLRKGRSWASPWCKSMWSTRAAAKIWRREGFWLGRRVGERPFAPCPLAFLGSPVTCSECGSQMFRSSPREGLEEARLSDSSHSSQDAPTFSSPLHIVWHLLIQWSKDGVCRLTVHWGDGYGAAIQRQCCFLTISSSIWHVFQN